MTHRRRSGKPHARILPALALLFALGGALRFASGLSVAFAQGTAPAAPDSAPPSPVPMNEVAAAAPQPPPDFGNTSNAAQILIEMRQRELALNARETALQESEALIRAAQNRLQTQIDALQSAERDLSATMALADRAAEADIDRLVSVFEAMGSEEAAAVFAEMAPDFAAGFLARLAPATAAAILTGLEPRQAYGLSAILAGRNALVPRD